MLKQHCSENQRFSFSESSMLTRKPCVNESTNQVLQQNCREISLLSEGISRLSVIPIFDAQFFFWNLHAFPWGSQNPEKHWKRGKAAAYSPWYPRVLPDLRRVVFLLMVATESQRTWLLAKKSCWYDWYVCIYIYKWTELTCQLDCLLVTKTWISQLCPVWFFSALKTKLVNPPIFGVKNRIQTWLGNPRTKWWIFHCHVRLPDGTNIKHHYVPC